MTRFLKVEGYDSLVRDTSSNAIVSSSKTEYQMYMQRCKSREKQGDEIRGAIKEINNLKSEFKEIKNLLTKVLSKQNGN
jgi:hypothetical protein|tara:strand:- start:156 stop:392 length:237 start_codon:yes stop_codon:yes gene_type:complete